MERQRSVFILSTDEQEIEQLSSMLLEGPYGSKVFRRLEELEAGLKGSGCLAAILDVDSVPLSNRIIRILKNSFPEVSFFCTSLRRLHPELQDALSHYVCACLSKPVDPEELQFWLRSVHDNASDSRTPR